MQANTVAHVGKICTAGINPRHIIQRLVNTDIRQMRFSPQSINYKQVQVRQFRKFLLRNLLYIRQICHSSYTESHYRKTGMHQTNRYHFHSGHIKRLQRDFVYMQIRHARISVFPENIDPQITSIEPAFFAFSKNISLLLQLTVAKIVINDLIGKTAGKFLSTAEKK